jgi:DNA repair exonuclease SbcCD nuclease subunit
MKLVILGDTHFGGGYSLGTVNSYRQLNSRLIDFSNTFDHVIDYIKTNGVKHFAITGDIFEYRRPQASELGLFSEKLQRLSEIGVHTHIVIGNHDMIRDQCATTIDVLDRLKLPMVHIYTDINSVKCENGNDAINLIFFPFRTRQMLDCSTNEAAVRRLSDRLQYEIRGISKDPKILIGHFMLQGTMLGSAVIEGHADEISLPTEMFKDLDGAIMGHIHPHHIVQKSPFVAYVGSMERKDFGDGGHLKYFLVVNYDNGKLVYQFEKLPVRPIYDIELDQSMTSNGKLATEQCIGKLGIFAKKHKVADSIIRMNILINERSVYDLDKDRIRNFLKRELLINHCVSIHTQVVSKRQLRKSTITERIDPIKSFEEYLTLVENEEMRELMRIRGSRIINGRSEE